MKIAVIGDSHIGALKRAWDQVSARHGNVEIVFFGARAMLIGDLRLDGDRLTPTVPRLESSLRYTSGGRCEIRPGEFDSILLYGMGARPYFLDQTTFYSKQVLWRAVQDVVLDTLSFRLLELVSSIYRQRIYVGHNPLMASSGEAQQDGTSEYLAGISLLNASIYEPRRALLLPQPIDTIVNGRNTHVDYAKGSRRLGIANVDSTKPFGEQLHREGELHHMNDAFGVLWLNAFLARPDGGGECGAVA